MSKIIDVKNYTVDKEDVFILDTNIYVYLYLSHINNEENYIEYYSDLYHQILEAGSKILTTSMQVSEFFNLYSKFRFKEYKERIAAGRGYEYKDYRSTRDYLNVLNELKLIIQNRILKNSTPIPDSFDSLPIHKILRSGKPYDFNDEYLINLARIQGAKIVTHDKDIVLHDSDIEVITVHKE